MKVKMIIFVVTSEDNCIKIIESTKNFAFIAHIVPCIVTQGCSTKTLIIKRKTIIDPHIHSKDIIATVDDNPLVVFARDSVHN